MLKIPIISAFNNKGIKDAEKSVGSFSKTLKKFGLASKFSMTAATAAIGLFAKQSIAAAIAEEKAVKSLSLTLKNLGIAAADKRVNQFIENLQMASGVSEDTLRPAFQRLLVTTKEVAKSQELLGLAMDISAGTGKSLDTVVMALTKAYNGSNTSLSRLGVNLTKAELKTMTFDEVTTKLAKTFKGQAAQAADTLGGRLARLNVAADEAKETIGVALAGSLDKAINKAGGIDTITFAMNGLAQATADAITNTDSLTGKFAELVSTPFKLAMASVKISEGLSKAFGGLKQPKGFGAETYSEDKRMGNRVKELKIAAAIPKQSAAELRNQRQLAANKKLAAKFDQENIAIEAALKGKLSEEDRARLLALKALKSESKADDEKALNDLNDAQKKAAAQEMASIKEREQASLDAISKQKSEYQALTEWLKSNPINVYTQFTNLAGQVITAPGAFGMPPSSNAASSAPPATNASSGVAAGVGGSNLQYGTYGATGDINITVNAGTIADENKLVYIIADQITKFQRFGGVTAPAGFI